MENGGEGGRDSVTVDVRAIGRGTIAEMQRAYNGPVSLIVGSSALNGTAMEVWGDQVRMQALGDGVSFLPSGNARSGALTRSEWRHLLIARLPLGVGRFHFLHLRYPL